MVKALLQRGLRKLSSKACDLALQGELEWRRQTSRSPYSRTIAFNHKPVGGPYGGGNQWLLLLSKHLASLGWRVRFDLRAPVDVIVLMNVSSGEELGMGIRDIEAYKQRTPTVKVLHRLNEADKHRSSAHLDSQQQRANRIADYSVFVSEWLRDYHSWFDRSSPHSVIHNGADDRIFFPTARILEGQRKLRIVTHHWSNNWAKGFEEYLALDRLIATGTLPETELWVIGRWPEGAQWQSARCFPPCRGNALAALLRQCDLYITASRFEAGAMHPVEAAQCGLPILYHRDTGGTVEVARHYGIEFETSTIMQTIQRARQNLPSLREAVIRQKPSGATMCQLYTRAIDEMLRASAPCPALPEARHAS